MSRRGNEPLRKPVGPLTRPLWSRPQNEDDEDDDEDQSSSDESSDSDSD